jgi:hypothetical protein
MKPEPKVSFVVALVSSDLVPGLVVPVAMRIRIDLADLRGVIERLPGKWMQCPWSFLGI